MLTLLKELQPEDLVDNCTQFEYDFGHMQDIFVLSHHWPHWTEL